jgi:acyl-CoA synthetase (AMP-forming)/AMP-acid ligase II
MSVSTQLHHELFQQTQNMSQKVALMLDEQMFSFAEIMQCVQIVVAHLLKKIPGVQQNEIVYHMLQRSVELPIAYFGFLAAGGVYCALNPADRTGRARYVLVQEATDRPMYAHLPMLIRQIINRAAGLR